MALSLVLSVETLTLRLFFSVSTGRFLLRRARSERQVKMRAKRLGDADSGFFVLSENDMTTVEKRMQQLSPSVMVAQRTRGSMCCLKTI